MKREIWLVAGIVVTLLYIVFGTHLYEAMYYEREFSNEMFNENLYFLTSLITAGMAWGVSAVYYYAINSVRFSRWYHWLVMLGIMAVATPIINYIHQSGVFSRLGYDFSAQMFFFSLVDFAVSVVMFVVASFSMRWWSTNCRHTPIPE